MKLLPIVSFFWLTACGAALELQKFDGASSETAGSQQAIVIDLKPLTFNEVRFLNSQVFERQVARNAILGRSGRVKEKDLVAVNPPPSTKPRPYRIGVSDQLSLSLVGAKAVQPTGVNTLVDGEVDLTSFGSTQAEPAILSSPSTVSSDGSVLFLETGKLKLEGLTILEAEAVVSDALIRNNVDPLFQLTVTQFASQYVSLVVNNIGKSLLVPLTSRPMTMRELISSQGIGFLDGKLVIVQLKRDNKTYSMPLEHVFDARSPEYYLESRDVLSVDYLSIAPSAAYLSVSTGTPVAFPLTPEAPASLADMLFLKDGPLANRRARLSEVYLLRGTNPISAYHLDAEDVSRLVVAREVELRPGDIVFVSDKPVYTALELLSVINPFKAFYESFE